MGFQSFQFDARLNANIKAQGYTQPTPIQAQSMPAILEKRDVMGLAQTGTGKTAAFVLPIIQGLLKDKTTKGVRALVVAPTRELAQQIHEEIVKLSHGTGLGSVTLYGGVNIKPQIKSLQQGVDIVVACPGRLLDHVEQRTINLMTVKTLVLDEADQMFDMGFLPSIRRILRFVPKQRQTLLFSATMPEAIHELAHDILVNPVMVKVAESKAAKTVKHTLFPVAKHLKVPLLIALLKSTTIQSVLVFTRTKHSAKKVAQKLEQVGFSATSLQGNLSQNKRQEAMNGFRDGSLQILVATDIAARGIDVTRISHVINFDIPSTVETYIHRIGRTGRAEKFGEAFTLISAEDASEVRSIERVLGGKIEQRLLDGFDYDAKAASPMRKLGERPEGRVLAAFDRIRD